MRGFSGFRFVMSMLLKSLDLNMDFIKIQNKKFFNNPDKVVGWFNGYPSMSLYTPPFFSKASTNSLITRMMSLYQWRKLPELMSIAITPKCNCDCAYCSFTSMKKEESPLSTEKIKKVIREAQDLGVSTISIVGGEPLMNPDILEIIQSVDKNRSQVIMFTNGYFLKEKAKDLRKTGLTTVIVSIDSSDSLKHNQIKGKDGLFEKAVSGVKEAKKHGLLVGMSSVVHKKDFQDGELVKLFDLAKDLKINELIVFDALPTGNYSDRTDLLWSKSDIEGLINLCEEYSQKKGYPNIYPYAYMKSNKSIGCAGGTLYFYVSPYGDVCPCDFNSFSVGNIKNESLNQVWNKFNDANGFCGSVSDGCRVHKK
ncbi:MAG TPA: radical SAM protein [Spirochaetota bacterium]|nr:radical SAM protein [Spirochaetota bacterium]